MKRKTTKELLVESFRELAQNRTIDKITIKDIVDNCEYSSATFYRHFKDKYDLIAWAYSQDIEIVISKVIQAEKSWKESLFETAKYYSEHKEYLENLLLHTSGYDAFVLNMTEINYKALMKMMVKAGGPVDDEMKMVIRIYVSGTVCLTCEWILGRYKVSPESLAQAYIQAIPELIGKYLC
ncbi:MAG: TetR/AcrR family transcriptional regulator C-terminal domain-containing protein [Spirochaetales bacterium]|nr:TetR/AcrR family transcriptional regulator C-terminal domain-containing protein [Spirochaetales bacterium]